VTQITTTARIAHLIAEGKVTQHRAPYLPAHEGKLPWAPGHSHAVVPLGRRTVCRVVVVRWAHVQLGDLTPADMHDTGHRTRLDLARWWLRTQILRRVAAGKPWTDDEILDTFEARHANRIAWRLDFAVDRSHEPRLLHEDPAQNYTSITAKAAQGEPEGVPAWHIERGVDAARARHTAGVGLVEQQQVEEITTLEGRLARLRQVAPARGIDVSSEIRAIERTIHRAERKLGRVA
jgi:hypothetical protein